MNLSFFRAVFLSTTPTIEIFLNKNVSTCNGLLLWKLLVSLGLKGEVGGEGLRTF